MASLMYLKIFKQIEIEMSLPRDQRTDAETLLKNLRQQMTQVSETAPRIQERAILDYQKRFQGEPVSKPLVANGLEQVKIYQEIGGLETPRHKINIRVDAPSAVANTSPKARITI